jgi:hypothetical protein
MSKPTIDDVMTAIAGLSAKVDEVNGRVMRQRDFTSGLNGEIAKARADLLRVEANLSGAIEALRDDLTRVEAKVDAHRAETAKAFAALEKELAGHADPVHAELEADIAAIHKGLVREDRPIAGFGRQSLQKPRPRLHEPQPTAVHVGLATHGTVVQTTGPESTPLSTPPLSVPPLSFVAPSVTLPSLPPSVAASFVVEPSGVPVPPLLDELEPPPLEEVPGPSVAAEPASFGTA